jgi:predicted enzyme related to lactoylglutathione lyase
MTDESMQGRLLWHELLTSDPEAAQRFYKPLIGWETSVFEQTGEPYTMWTYEEQPMGGVMALPAEAAQMGVPPHWLLYVGVDDVDATVEQAKRLGGRALRDSFDVPTVGRIGILADPQGAVFAIFTPSERAPAEQEAGVGDFSWHELATTDHAAAMEFYSALFGWQKTEAMDMGEGNMYQMYGRGGDSLGGMFTKPAEMPGPAAWLLYIRVADTDKAVEQVEALGGQVINGPMDVPGPSGDRVAQCMDAQGVAFALHSSSG